MTVMPPDDDRFAAFLRATVPQLDEPSIVVPREEMWTRIMAQRHGHALLDIADEEDSVAEPPFVPAAPAVVTAPPVRVRRTISVWGRGIPVRWAVPLVAAVLVVGIGLGLQVGQRRVRTLFVQVADGVRPATPVPPQVITEQHFRKVEQLLTTFASYKANGKETSRADAKIVAQARALLSTTQLLLDSPVALDPQRRHLLTDIELALMQITQLAPAGPAADRDFVEHSIERSQVVQRLQQEQTEPAKSPAAQNGL